MKKIVFIFIMFIGLSVNAQANKPFIPTKGEITFKEVSKIIDRKLFDKDLQISKEKFKKTLQNSLLKESNGKGKEIEIEQMVSQNAEMMEMMMFPQDSSQIYAFKFDNFKIISSNSADEIMSERYEVIDTQKNISTTFSKIDSTTTFNEKIYAYSSNIILRTIVDKKSKKTINGYDCYKVIYEYKENNEGNDEDYLEFIRNTIYKREMWVTDKIRSLYHPVVFEKSILEKYYPLDILETQSDIKGYERKFTLQTLTLK
ncbi:hypothetical protein [Chryseobacterium sp. MYb7]|uniref:hypothetical protein n=1 Tax=Chryseobacterium sp. MYb7 TaxID=1827290 RepID=UPI000CFFA11F|nr:hypothetical protein [Chryseobacterium sp. MYb7]